MTDLQRALADRDCALRGLREVQAVLATREAQLARSIHLTEQACALVRRTLALCTSGEAQP